ncbi:MAG: transglycosylase SLT domain-containing protein [Endomicrobiia bacterium]
MNEKIYKILPETPGVYLMRDYSGEILYIGKARNLKKRVSSYFTKSLLDPKIIALISSIKTVDYIVAKSERDALLLENKLIKKLQPKYNIMWRDDKSYPYIKLTIKDDFPYLCLVRQKKEDGSKYFGPYHNVSEVRKLIRKLRSMFHIRPCTKTKFKGKCFYFDLGQCPGPCIGKISTTQYKKNIKNLLLFLEGKYEFLKNILKKEMKIQSEKLNFEEAGKIRDIIFSIDRMFEKISFHEIKETDLTEHLNLSRTLSQLKETLQLPKVPITIEAFDVSNISGKEAVGSMVSFFQGRPDKKNYRRYKIKTINYIDDYAMIKEIVHRRYTRLLTEHKKLPDLIIIDGGKGHLSSAKEILDKIGLENQPIISIAKKEEEIFKPEKEEPIKLSSDSPVLKLIQYIRDEAHRFALSYHRYRRKIGLTLAGIILLCFNLYSGRNQNIYDDIIIYHSYKNNIDPYLVKAIIKVESDFAPKLISSKKAKGLMQLIDEIIKKEGIDDPFDPYQNIGAGVRHLSLLMEIFDNDIDKVLSAYNAGISSVKKHNGIPPYKETQDFVYWVKKYYKLYKTTQNLSKKRIYSFTDSKGMLYFFNR